MWKIRSLQPSANEAALEHLNMQPFDRKSSAHDLLIQENTRAALTRLSSLEQNERTVN